MSRRSASTAPRLLQRGGNRAAKDKPTPTSMPSSEVQSMPMIVPSSQGIFRLPAITLPSSTNEPVVLVTPISNKEAAEAVASPPPSETTPDVNELLALVFRCRLCDKSFETKEAFQEHARTTHLTPPKTRPSTSHGHVTQVFVCAHCSQKFSRKEDCRMHMNNMHPKVGISKSYETTDEESEIEIDDDEDGALNELQEDQSDRQEERRPAAKERTKFKCPRPGCPYRFSSANLALHLSCHTSPKIDTPDSTQHFSCPKCRSASSSSSAAAVSFSRWSLCAMHLWREHGLDSGLLQCPICKDGFKTLVPATMDNHISNAHRTDKVLKCGSCKKLFNNLEALQSHMMSHMNGNSEMLRQWLTKRRCDLCSKVFSDSKCLKKHVQSVHSGLRPYICHVCSHKSARKAMLDLHMRQHTGEKPHQCPECPYRTGDHNSLRRHMFRHGRARPYKCPFCVYVAAQSSTFIKHVARRHPDQGEGTAVFSCQKCSYKSINRDHFFEHISKHQREDSSASTTSQSTNPKKSAASSSSTHPVISIDESSNSSVASSSIAEEEDSVKDVPMEEDTQDSLMAATADMGGTTIPAGDDETVVLKPT